eukprot:TRINITY_DN7174_c0_g1_i5.p1 TRINITY_DN7174_c0_g1~~TRINITY_DN7174_c0_g1_i5.p1  ORF type:complete len:233 (-),score=34.18 TRINITY_DN7174_c0_g1_i5:76-774(-)
MLEGLHQHHQYMAVIDAWILEVEEASQLTEEIEARIRDKDALIAIGKDPSPILVGARRKLMILGTKLDRLESLLHNPPAKPVLNQNDLQSRKDMISDMRQRTRQLANCLCTSKFTTKQDAREPDTSAKLTISNNVQGLSVSKTVDPEKMFSSVKNQTTISEEAKLDVPLLDKLDKECDSEHSVLWVVQNQLGVVGEWFDRWCEKCRSIFSVLLIVVAIILLVFIIGAVIEYI